MTRSHALELLNTQPAEGLRATAALIRETARAATPGPWEPSPKNEAVIAPEAETSWLGAEDWYGGQPVAESLSEADRAHVLAWQPRKVGSGTDLMPLISAETRHRQYDVTGLRRNEHGDVVFQLKDAEL